MAQGGDQTKAEATKAVKAVGPKAPIIEVDGDKLTQQTQIASAAREVIRDNQAASAIRDKMLVLKDKLPAADEVANLVGQLEAARERLKEQVLGSTELNELAEQLSEANLNLRNSKAELSKLLVGWVAKYQTKSVAVEGSMRLIDLKAQLGKEVPNQQELPLWDR